MTGTDLVLWDPPYCYEMWEFDSRLTKDAARRLLAIADIFDWDMPWVSEMREWA